MTRNSTYWTIFNFLFNFQMIYVICSLADPLYGHNKILLPGRRFFGDSYGKGRFIF